ncbi:MAG: putative entry exclusion protein TrbK-alt [Bradyrhizobium sp.]|uniref:putative entry exclusion protein TrbK-alt n=1 Tax=Bradyrhizobium sp. TaxID=376 RepID=UPI003D12A1B5
MSDFKALYAGVTIFVVALAAACTIYLRDGGGQPQPASSVVREPDPVAAELERCRSIGYEQKDRLAECRKVWADQRRQFLGQSSNRARPDPDATPAVSVRDQGRLPSGLFPKPMQTER